MGHGTASLQASARPVAQNVDAIAPAGTPCTAVAIFAGLRYHLSRISDRMSAAQKPRSRINRILGIKPAHGYLGIQAVVLCSRARQRSGAEQPWV
jgi:hypothetical protein